MTRVRRVADPIVEISDLRVRFSEYHRLDIPDRVWLDAEWIPFKDFDADKLVPMKFDFAKTLSGRIVREPRDRGKFATLDRQLSLKEQFGKDSRLFKFFLRGFKPEALTPLPEPIVKLKSDTYTPIFSSIWDGELVLFTRMTRFIEMYEDNRLWAGRVSLIMEGDEVQRVSVLPDKEKHAENVRRIRIRRKK